VSLIFTVANFDSDGLVVWLTFVISRKFTICNHFLPIQFRNVENVTTLGFFNIKCKFLQESKLSVF
jgi:hypothetical protein